MGKTPAHLIGVLATLLELMEYKMDLRQNKSLQAMLRYRMDKNITVYQI